MDDIAYLLDQEHAQRPKHWMHGEFVALLSQLLGIPTSSFAVGRRSTRDDLRVEIRAWGAAFEIRPRGEHHHELVVGTPAHHERVVVPVDLRIPASQADTAAAIKANRLSLHDAIWTWPNACRIIAAGCDDPAQVRERMLLPNGRPATWITYETPMGANMEAASLPPWPMPRLVEHAKAAAGIPAEPEMSVALPVKIVESAARLKPGTQLINYHTGQVATLWDRVIAADGSETSWATYEHGVINDADIELRPDLAALGPPWLVIDHAKITEARNASR